MKAGDIVSMNVEAQSISFAINGEDLGTAFRDNELLDSIKLMEGQLVPCVFLGHEGDRVKIVPETEIKHVQRTKKNEEDNKIMEMQH